MVVGAIIGVAATGRTRAVGGGIGGRNATGGTGGGIIGGGRSADAPK